VRSKNALNTMMMSFISLGFVALAWAFVGYSLAFTPGNNWIGDTSAFFLKGVGMDLPVGISTALIPHSLFMCFQATFCIIHGGADLGRRLSNACGSRPTSCSSRCGRSPSTRPSRTGSGAVAGWLTWAPSTSPAARSCT
jgi:hypothetical protein